MRVSPYIYKGVRLAVAAFVSCLMSGILLLPSDTFACGPAGRPSSAWNEAARLSDVESVDGLIRALYESISFPEGKTPDWERFRGLFVSAASPCVRMASDGVSIMDRESFIAFFSGRITKGTMKSFAEREIARATEVYGGLVQVFSTYEKRANLADAGKPTRGINGVQLFFKGGRWWIAALVWQDELADLPIPPKYLK